MAINDDLPGGGADLGGGVDTSIAIADNDEISPDLEAVMLRNDPEYAEIQAAIKGKKAADKDSGKKKEKEPVIDDESILDEKEPAAKSKKVDVIEEPVSGDGDFDTLEFEDNVIPGVKGEDLKKLGAEGVAALADYHEKNTVLADELTRLKAENEKLISDPVIKARKEMLDKNITQYNVRQVSPAEKQSAVDLVVARLQQTDLDLTPDEARRVAEAAFETLKPGFEQIAKDAAHSHIQNMTAEQAAKVKAEETIRNARGVFLNFGKFNKDFTFTETNPNAFWIKDANGKDVLNESHKEIAQYKKVILPVMQAFGSAGMSHENILKLAEKEDGKALYAFAAAQLNLPVALNTERRDAAMVAGEVRSRLKSFLKSNASEELPADGGKTNSSKKRDNSIEGVDLDRILDDEGYLDEVLRRNPSPDWMDRVDEITAKAKSLRNAKNKKK